MAKAVIRGINLNYEIKGDRGRSVILLHGWGQNMAMMDYIATFLWYTIWICQVLVNQVNLTEPGVQMIMWSFCMIL